MLQEKLLGIISCWKLEYQEGAFKDKTNTTCHGTQQSPLCEADIATLLVEQRLKKSVLEKHRSLQMAKRKTRRKKVCDEEKYSDDLDRSDDKNQDEKTHASPCDSPMKEDSEEKKPVSSWDDSSILLLLPESESTRHKHPPTEVAVQAFENDCDDNEEWW